PAIQPEAEAHLRRARGVPRDADHRRGGRRVPPDELTLGPGSLSGRGRNSGQLRTGCRGYFSGSSGQRMNVLDGVRTYRGGAAQRWQRLSGNGNSSDTAAAYRAAALAGSGAFSCVTHGAPPSSFGSIQRSPVRSANTRPSITYPVEAWFQIASTKYRPPVWCTGTAVMRRPARWTVSHGFRARVRCSTELM